MGERGVGRGGGEGGRRRDGEGGTLGERKKLHCNCGECTECHRFVFTCTCNLPCLALPCICVRNSATEQLSCLGSLVGRALSLESRVSWVQIPSDAAKKKFLWRVELICFALFSRL